MTSLVDTIEAEIVVLTARKDRQAASHGMSSYMETCGRIMALQWVLALIVGKR